MNSNQQDNPLQQTLNLINLNISFRDDTKYINLDISLRVLIFTLIKTINTCVSLVNAQQYEINDNTTSGTLYNGIYATHPYSTNTLSTDEIQDKEFNAFCMIFKNTMDDDQRLGIYSKQIQDPRLCTFEFLHYLYIPVRVDVSTLSDDIKINSLRKYITVIMFLPYLTQYTDRYLRAINNVEFMQKVHSNIITINGSISNIAQQMMNMRYDFIVKSLQPTYTISNTMMVYLRVYTNIIILVSIEILKKWCPNISECMRINPDFDGQWINPFDIIVNEQISFIQDLVKMTKTEKMTK